MVTGAMAQLDMDCEWCAPNPCEFDEAEAYRERLERQGQKDTEKAESLYIERQPPQESDERND